jgi:hypothetical protein
MYNPTNVDLQKTKRGSLQLWQFLLQMLKLDGQEIIEWTNKSLAEFKLLDPEEVFKAFRSQKSKKNINI